MSFADANRASIRVIEETEWGTTPTSGTSREVRLTSSSLAATKETTESDELRQDRMISAITEVSAASSGDINFEMSAGAQDEFLAAFLLGTWSRPMYRDFFKGRTVSVTGSSEITVSGRDVSGYMKAGYRILLKGFDSAANNGYFSIDSVSFSGGDTVITISESTLTQEAGKATSALYDANDVVVLNNSTIASTANGFSGTGNVFSAAIAAGQLVPGQKIVVDGLDGVTGVYRILSVDVNDIVTQPSPTAIVAAGDPVVVKGSMLRNPATADEIAQRKFTIETAFNDVNQYQIQNGMVPGTFSLDVSTGSIITGTVGFQGRATSVQQTTLLADAGSYDVLDSQPGEVVNATTNVGDIEKDGAVLSAALQSISLSGEANLRQQTAIGSKFARGIGTGRFNLSGSATAYFEDDSLFRDFLDHATVQLSFPITDLDGQMYVYTLPAVKFSADSIAPGGIDQDVMDNVEFSAFRDPETSCMLQVDRFSPNK